MTNRCKPLVYNFLNLMKLISVFICSGSEFQILLPPHLAVLWTFTYLDIIWPMCQPFRSTKYLFRFSLFRILKTPNPKVLWPFTSIMHLLDLSRRLLKWLSNNCYNECNFQSALAWVSSRLGWGKMPYWRIVIKISMNEITDKDFFSCKPQVSV